MSWTAISNLLSGAILALLTLSFSVETAEPQQAKWSLILVIGALGLLARKANVLAFLAVALIAWGAVTLSWSADWRNGFVIVIHALAILGLCSWGLWRQAPIALGLACIGVAAIWGFGPEWLFGGFGNRNFAAEFLLMAAPFAFLHPRLRYPALLCVAWVLSNNYGALKWLACGAILTALVMIPAWRRREIAISITGALGCIAIFLTLAWSPRLQTSLLARVELGWNSLAMIADRPFYGWGLGSFNAVYPDYSDRHKAILGDWSILDGPLRYAGAAHNDWLQLHLELGMVGWAMAIAFLALLIRHFYRKPKDRLDWAAGISLMTGGLLALFSFPFQNAATCIVAVVSVCAIARGMETFGLTRWRPFVGPCLTAFVLWTVWPQHLASIHYGVAIRTALDNATYAYLADLKAIEVWPYARGPRHQAEIMMAGAMVRQGATVSPEIAEQMHRISRSAAGNDRGIALAHLAYLERRQ